MGPLRLARRGRGRSLLNTRGFTFFGFDWANRAAVNYICATCGYIMWFLPEPAR